jgi:hypothetical protein
LNKREFLASAALGAAALASPANATPGPLPSPALLTITGNIGRGNRGPLDPVLDQMMKKQGIRFDKGHAFDFASLVSLPAVTIRPTLEYDEKPHSLRGPLLTDVLAAAGARRPQAEVVMRAIDGYAPTVTLADIARYRFIVATHLDGKPMPVGGLGPLWALYDADRFPDMAGKPLNERFGNCPWGLYHIEVR